MVKRLNILCSAVLGAVFFASSVFLALPTSLAAMDNGYRVFNIKINVEWSVNKDKIQAGGTPVYEAIGAGTIEVSLYFPLSGGEALKNNGLGKITEYDNKNGPAKVTIAGVGLKNESISFYKPVWDGKNTIIISGVEYTAIPIDVTFHHPSPVKPVTISDACVWDRMLGAFTEAQGLGKIKEFKLNTSLGASNYFPKVYFDKEFHHANLTFIVEDKGVLKD